MTASNPLAPPAILLAGGGPGAVHPVDADGTPLSLLPLACAPVLSYPLRWVEAGGVSSVLVVSQGLGKEKGREERRGGRHSNRRQWAGPTDPPSFSFSPTRHTQVVAGDAAADKVRAYLKATPPVRIPVRVLAVPEDAPAGAALAAALESLPPSSPSSPLVLAPGDLVTDAPLAAALLRHFVDGAGATVLLAGACGVDRAGGKPGRSPAGVDYTAVSPANDLLLLAPAASRDDVRRALRVPRGAVVAWPTLTVRCDARATGAVVVARGALAAALARKPRAASLTRELVPAMVRAQWRRGVEGEAESAAGSADGGAVPPAAPDRAATASPAPAPPRPPPAPRRVKAFTAPPSCIALRAASSAAAFLDAARDVAASGGTLLPPGVDAVSDSVQFGVRATVSAGCVAGAAVILGDKAAVKRSTLGAHVRLGKGAKVVGCALLDGCAVDDGASLQGCVVGRGAHIGANASLRDCFVGPDYDVPAGADERDAVLASV